jgi:hypothetical protein
VQAVVGYFIAMSALNTLLMFRPVPLFMQDVADWLNAGNPFTVFRRLTEAIARSGRHGEMLIEMVRNYVLFHLTLTAMSLVWAILRLRPVAAAHADGPPPKKQTGLFRPPLRPPVGDKPVFWKAQYFEFRQAKSVFGRSLGRVLFVLSFMPVTLVLFAAAFIGRGFDLVEIMNTSIVRGLGTTVLCGVLVMIAAYTSSCIAAERRKKTLEDLLLTDLSTDEILAQKWWASLFVIRWALIWVGIHWLIGVLTGALHPLAVPLLALEWLTYAAFAASTGMYCAARWIRSREAGVYTGAFGIFIPLVLPLFLAILVGLSMNQLKGDENWFILPMSMSPPMALGITGFTGAQLTEMRLRHTSELKLLVGGISTSVILFAFLAWRLWRGAKYWFPRTVGR